MDDFLKLSCVLAAMENNKENYIEFYEKGKQVKKVFADVHNDVAAAASYLKNIGGKKGGRIGIIGANSYEYMILDLAAVTGGYVSVPFPEKAFGDSIDALPSEYGLNILFADQRYISEKRISTVRNLETLRQDAQKASRAKMSPVAIEDDSIFTIILIFLLIVYALYLSAQRLPDFYKEALAVSPELRQIQNEKMQDKIIDFLPLHISNARLFVYAAVLIGYNLVLTDTSQLLRVLSLSQPTIMQGVPYLFETFYDTFMNMKRQSLRKRILYGGDEILYALLPVALLNGLRERIFRDLYNLFGTRMRILVTGSAPTQIKLLKFYEKAGLRIFEVYGINEVGLVSMNSPGAYRMGSVGKPFATKSILISEEGEILIKSDYAWGTGYINDDQDQGRLTFREDGYVATGDIGYLDEDGYLYVVGRIKEVIVLSNGDKIHPRVIEDELKRAAEIKQAVVFGSGKAFLSCIIVREDRKTSADQLKEVINKANETVADSFMIREFVIADEPFTTENGLLNATLKVDRKAIYERYRSQIDKLYKK